jgi:hypothetical protein
MPKRKEYYETLMTREFYDFYKKIRRRNSPQINQYNLFVKVVGGMMTEMRRMMEETQYGISFKGLGIMYKRPFGELLKKVNMFTQKTLNRNMANFYLEDDYLRGEYIVTNLPRAIQTDNKKIEDKGTAILLHRKLKLKR